MLTSTWPHASYPLSSSDARNPDGPSGVTILIGYLGSKPLAEFEKVSVFKGNPVAKLWVLGKGSALQCPGVSETGAGNPTAPAPSSQRPGGHGNPTLKFKCSFSIEGTVFKIGLVGPWNCHPFFGKAFPQMAAKLALRRIKEDTSLNVGHELNWTLLEEDCHTCTALARFVGYEKLASAFVGPLSPGYCDTAALLSKTWNKTIFSWTCVNYEGDRPHCPPALVWTLPPPTDVLVAVLKYFNWAHVGIVSSQEDFWVDTANRLAVALRNQGLPVRLVTTIDDRESKVEEAWSRIQAAEDIKVIILCMPSALVGGEAQSMLLTQAQEKGLADGRYIFVPYDTLLYSLPYRNHSYFLLDKDRTFREAYDAVLTITVESGEQTFYEAFEAAKGRGEITTDLEPQQLSPLFGTIYDAIYLVAKTLDKARRPGTSEISGMMLAEHVKNLNFEGFSHRIQVNSKGQVIANYVILDTDGKGGYLSPTYLLLTSSGLLQPLGRAIHFPGGDPPPADSSCWFDPDVLCIRGIGPPIVILVLLPLLFLLLFGICLVYLFRHSAFYRHVIQGSKKLLLTLDDLTFVHAKLSRMKLTLDNFSETKSHAEGRSLKSATRSGSMKSASVTYDTSNVAVYEGNWVWLKKLECGSSGDLKLPATSFLSKMKDLRHENVNPFLGLLSDGSLSAMVVAFCSRGSLEDLLQNTEIKLDWMFKSSLLTDLIKGMKYLHHRDILHGRLKSRNCLVDGRFVLRITDYGYSEFLAAQQPNKLFSFLLPSELLWTAPELLRDSAIFPKGTLKGDVYSFAIVLQEVVLRGPPYCTSQASAEEIIRKLKKTPPSLRPNVSLDSAPLDCIQLMKQCWSESPDRRPAFDEIFEQFKTINKGRKNNIVDSMLRMLEQYSSNLEDLIRERTEELELEKLKTEKLLTQMLPLSVAETLKTGATVEPEYFDEVTIYFSDIIGFTTISALSEPIEIVDLLNDLYTMFDAVISHHDVYKVETIGDAYMVASGLPKRNGQRHAAEIANMALDILSSVGSFTMKHLPGVPVRIRMGLHSGPCAAGVVGLTMPRYCLFGDTVNTASRIESTGLPYRIHISQITMKILKSLNEGYKMEFRGKTELKGKGLQETYWLVGKTDFGKLLPRPPEVKPGQPWQDTVVREIKAALRDPKRRSISKQKPS
ncbi:retinal guanylyl cyclase 2 [Sphaerodactylus townsendi]|uniref:retinal guanylyl cyclase 2 n=1 Tax=Sphaerodactylus townsendi TaxID=933632 RepID=UPI0020266D3F|nr:retinal guanylyl cyclase 2 [Sphaerodactylus townsendi]